MLWLGVVAPAHAATGVVFYNRIATLESPATVRRINADGTGDLPVTIPLPSPASLCALRVGGDVDHNGFPDIAVISEQGSWPSYRNVFRVFKESSQPAALAARIAAPRGGEAFVGGSTRFVDWLAAVPAGVYHAARGERAARIVILRRP